MSKRCLSGVVNKDNSFGGWVLKYINQQQNEFFGPYCELISRPQEALLLLTRIMLIAS